MSPMIVPVVRIREVGMAMDQGYVSVPMTMSCPRRNRRIMGVVMMRVVSMEVVMFERFVNMLMDMALSQVHRATDRHQAACKHES